MDQLDFVDFQQVNAVTGKDAQPLPRIDDTLDTIGDFTISLHLTWSAGTGKLKQVRMTEKTAFSTPYDLYQFRVMLFWPV